MIRFYVNTYNLSEMHMAIDGLAAMMNAIAADCNEGCDNCEYSDLCGDLARTMHWLDKMIASRQRTERNS